MNKSELSVELRSRSEVKARQELDQEKLKKN
jgi:hypothetical protein